MDKTERLLHMTEHPEQYSDEALLEILADEETRELYDTMRLCADAFETLATDKHGLKRTQCQSVSVRVSPMQKSKTDSVPVRASPMQKSKADSVPVRASPMQKSKADSVPVRVSPMQKSKTDSVPVRVSPMQKSKTDSVPVGCETGQPKARRLSLWRIAAAFVGLLMISGIAYAAIRIGRDFSYGQTRTKADSESVRASQMQKHKGESVSVCVSTMQNPSAPQLFENTPLDSLVTTLARYYNKVADIRSATAHDLRLYYKWNPEDSLQRIVDDLNHFDRVSLTIDNDKLIAE